ncbi:phosphatidylglycerophosphatase A family protein [Colwellia piezophila]|uniref:phosphatidylglycerophosphatase A family protein n=1 Tax=Colwellia piezophila TaxID=211668 RepID=UPI00247FB0E7|nr:phosphatidylglycerophosphatase A [Colwellia piezophila]
MAYGFGTGLMPFAPGTFGTLVGVVLFWFMASMAAIPYAIVVAIMFFVGIFICGQTARDVGAIDPGFIVYDEVVGFLVAMFMLPAEGRWIVSGFVVFRIFDIWKPFPIHWVEDKLGLGSGIMTDDVIAGLYTLIILHTARLLIERFVS